ncbi:MAG: xanthine dehydrogenase family protein molybdopterin-binding subunit [Candidatus Limnocylindrales bacterium]
MTADRATSSAIGVSRPRPDSEAKVRGATRYAADRPMLGLLHGRLVLAPYARAHIRGIDTSEALAMPGVVAVLTGADLPIVGGDGRVGEPLAVAEVVFAGQPVAFVVAETPEAAADAVGAVLVDYEPLPPVVDAEAAMAVGSAVSRPAAVGSESGEEAAMHAAVGGEGDASIDQEALSPNVTGRHRYRAGDVRTAIAKAHAVVEGSFSTAWAYQAYIEPQTSTAWIESDGTLVVEVSTQGTFSARKDLTKALGLKPNRVVVRGMPLGGAFGAKFTLFEPLVASAAMLLRRPVRLELERLEDFLATNPGQGTRIDLRIGADEQGRFVGIDARLVFDAGAYDEMSVESIGAILVAGPYRWPAFDLSAYGVLTNRVGTGAFRGPGGPPTAFALETLIDELAENLGLDPIEVRLANAAVEGDPMVDGEPWPGIGLTECLEAIGDLPLWRDRAKLPEGEGVGIAAGVWPGSKDAAAAACRVEADGTITIVTGVIDMSGTTGSFMAIAAEVLGVPLDDVAVVMVDTAGAPTSPASAGSTVTYSAGRAVRAAAEDLRERLVHAAAIELEIDPRDLEIVDGVVRPVGSPDRGLSIAKLARKNDREGRAPIEGHATTEHLSLAPSVAAHLAHVRVDRETGEVALLGYHVAQDVGRALNPALIEGQMVGGAAQSVGRALVEALVFDDSGQLLTGSFLDYAIPRAANLPEIGTTIVEVPAPEGPFGAKGIGEAGAIPGPAAIANAIAAAVGVRMRELPMSAPRIWRALQERV